MSLADETCISKDSFVKIAKRNGNRRGPGVLYKRYVECLTRIQEPEMKKIKAWIIN